MESQKKRRFIMVTVEPIMGNKAKGATGLLAGFPLEQDGETMFISLFKESNYYSLSTRVYLITEVHSCINGNELIVFYNHGIDMEESKRTMKKSLNHAAAVFKKFVAAAGVDLKKGVLKNNNVHQGYPGQDAMRRIADTPADSSTEKNKTGTPIHPLVVQKKEEPVTPSRDWREPLWISRRSNQHTAKITAKVKNELIKRIAETMAKATAAAHEEEVGADDGDETYIHRAGTARTIPSDSLCMACAAKWSCKLPIAYRTCDMLKEDARLSMYPDGLL